MKPVELKDPRYPSIKYITSLLRSEDIIANPEAVRQCLYGWKDAVQTPRAEREARTQAINETAFHHGDCEQIGYCTYTYLVIVPDMSHFAPKLKQLRMEI